MNFEEENGKNHLHFSNQDFYEPEKEIERTFLERIRKPFMIIVALVVIVGLMHNRGGIYQQFLYQRTPPSLVQETPQPVLEADPLTVPLTVFVVRGGELFGSERTLSDVRRLISNADTIWEQATIDLEAIGIIEIQLSDGEIEDLLRGIGQDYRTVQGYNPNTINVFLVKSLHGINGLAFGSNSTIFVADFTTVIDFRTFAHEVGHILGLGHVPGDRGRLMYRGANGFNMTTEEVITARKKAARF